MTYKINADIELHCGEVVNFTVENVLEEHMELFLLRNYLSPTKTLMDNYLVYVPELFGYPGVEIQLGKLKNVVWVR